MKFVRSILLISTVSEISQLFRMHFYLSTKQKHSRVLICKILNTLSFFVENDTRALSESIKTEKGENVGGWRMNILPTLT